jgi:hypothetical protein
VRTTLKFLVMGTICVAYFVLLAQSDADYQGLMKTVAKSKGALEKGVAAKDASVVQSEGSTLETTFKQVENFWKGRNVSDAAALAKQAHEAAAAASKAGAAGDFDKAGAEAKTIASTCAPCHMAHREKGDSGFKIK